MLDDYYYDEGIVPPDIHFRIPSWLKNEKVPLPNKSEGDDKDESKNNGTTKCLDISKSSTDTCRNITDKVIALPVNSPNMIVIDQSNAKRNHPLNGQKSANTKSPQNHSSIKHSISSPSISLYPVDVLPHNSRNISAEPVKDLIIAEGI